MPAVFQVTTKEPSLQPFSNSCSTQSRMGFRMMFSPFSRAVARILHKCAHSVRQHRRYRRLTLILHLCGPAAMLQVLHGPST